MATAVFMAQANGQSGLGKCQEEHQKAPHMNVIGALVLKCDVDGTYSLKQCSGSTEYCHCVHPTTDETISKPVRGEPPR